jgi:hypothetical protein
MPPALGVLLVAISVYFSARKREHNNLEEGNDRIPLVAVFE